MIQTVKRSPVNLRPALGIDPRDNAAALAWVLAASARMASTGLLPSDDGATRCEDLVERLAVLRTPGFAEPCWGYPFDVETRFFFYSAATPNSIATGFAGLALLEADARCETAGALELAEGAGQFFLEHVPQTRRGGGEYFGYLPGDRTPIHNANLLACALLARLAKRTGNSDFGAAARRGAAFALEHQRADGSWPYAEDRRGDWVDGLHTGYVLDALATCADALDDPEARRAHGLGLHLYADRLFENQRVPKYTDRQTYPIDGQFAAQAIRTFAVAGAEDKRWLLRSRAVHEYARERMLRDDGAFAFQLHRLWADRTPHVRWVQAPMLDALTVLYEAELMAAAAQEASTAAMD